MGAPMHWQCICMTNAGAALSVPTFAWPALPPLVTCQTFAFPSSFNAHALPRCLTPPFLQQWAGPLSTLTVLSKQPFFLHACPSCPYGAMHDSACGACAVHSAHVALPPRACRVEPVHSGLCRPSPPSSL